LFLFCWKESCACLWIILICFSPMILQFISREQSGQIGNISDLSSSAARLVSRPLRNYITCVLPKFFVSSHRILKITLSHTAQWQLVHFIFPEINRRRYFLELKQPERNTVHLPPPRADINSAYSCTSTLPNAFMAWCLKNRNHPLHTHTHTHTHTFHFLRLFSEKLKIRMYDNGVSVCYCRLWIRHKV
jgi:hypothetical protein